MACLQGLRGANHILVPDKCLNLYAQIGLETVCEFTLEILWKVSLTVVYQFNHPVRPQTCMSPDNIADICRLVRWSYGYVSRTNNKFWHDLDYELINRFRNGPLPLTHHQGLYSLRRRRLISIGNPIINLRRSSDRLRFIMGIPIPVRRRLLSE